MTQTVETTVEYLHQYEYRTRDERGDWSEPEVRYHNPTRYRDQAIKRHRECRDVEHTWDRKFEGVYGYSWKNCRLVTRVTTIIVDEMPGAVVD